MGDGQVRPVGGKLFRADSFLARSGDSLVQPSDRLVQPARAEQQAAQRVENMRR